MASYTPRNPYNGCDTCSNWYEELIEDYARPDREEYWWALSPTGRSLTAKLRKLVWSRTWNDVKNSNEDVLPCLCHALLKAIQLCAPDNENYYYQHCSKSMQDQLTECFFFQRDERYRAIISQGGEEMTDEPDEDPGDGYVEGFLREVASKSLEVHFTFLDDEGGRSACMGEARKRGLVRGGDPAFCLTVSVRGLFGIEVFAKQDDRNMARGFVRKPNDTASGTSFEHALSWIEDCAKCHNCVPRHGPSTIMPRRVLDLGTSMTGDAKLRVLNEETVTYVTLSHCWGSNQNSSPLKTIKANLEQHLTGIPTSRLSKTFKDAITFTRRLKIRYLWIDSLCIVQDDDADWKSEIPKMGSIYANSWLTLAAAKSGDGSGGLFSSSTPGHHVRYVECKSKQETGFYVRHMYDEKASFPNMSEHLDMNIVRTLYDASFPLFFRGWVTQERLLSPRTLYFCASELIYECSRTARCECYGTPWGSMKNPWIDEFEDDPYDGRKYAHYFDFWLDFVQSYSATRFTQPTDKIPALLGVNETLMEKMPHPNASEFHGRGQEDARLTYLLWERVERNPCYAEWVAPSWSCMAVNGDIAFRCNVRARDINAEVVKFEWRGEDVDVKSARSRRLGDVLQQVREGIEREGRSHHFIAQMVYSTRITVVGTVIPVEDKNDGSRPASSIELRLLLEESKFQLSASRNPFRNDPPVDSLGLQTVRKDYGFHNAELCILHLGNDYEGKKEHLLLLEMANKEEGVFRRIGMGMRKVTQSGIPESWAETFKRTLVII